ncbi:MAG: Uncharacterised protein [Owenweeksia sp. TMED14]|nr:MAG: Uncharacterised protein [Owenweeksia sp. TMED14]
MNQIERDNIIKFIKDVLINMPPEWVSQTTHRLDVYDEKLAKIDFLNKFQKLFNNNNSEVSALSGLPTAFDYIRLGHPLSCILEWAIAFSHNLKSNNAISFSSTTIPVLAILRKNLLDKKDTQIIYDGEFPDFFDVKTLKNVYGYKFELRSADEVQEILKFNGSNIFISRHNKIHNFDRNENIDFLVNVHSHLGAVLLVNNEQHENYITEIQHVRRRETIAMTPANSLSALNSFIDDVHYVNEEKNDTDSNERLVLESIKEITGTENKGLVGSSGLSIQYAILMGLIDDGLEKHRGKDIKIIVPPNCYGGTNDQARRVAACVANAEVLDLPVDSGDDMVNSIDVILDKIAAEDAIPYIIAEIPTNPRVEVPDLARLKDVLSKVRKTENGLIAIDPVFILDQTFCPNVHFLGENEILSTIRAISFASGSKFPSGGLCNAGYCVFNKKSASLTKKIEIHLRLCDNEATSLQMEILAKQLPTMNQRINDAYKNTREFVNFIQNNLPEAKINFVSEEFAKLGFTPSVFSLDLPTKGNTDEEKESYKRVLNYKLINLMIKEVPNESKFCVSYGQLKGCYWTIPATSTQGTTKEGDKDYIVRVSLSPEMNLQLHKSVFLNFVKDI